jgi:hypothetical protein
MGISSAFAPSVRPKMAAYETASPNNIASLHEVVRDDREKVGLRQHNTTLRQDDTTQHNTTQDNST